LILTQSKRKHVVTYLKERKRNSKLIINSMSLIYIIMQFRLFTTCVRKGKNVLKREQVSKQLLMNIPNSYSYYYIIPKIDYESHIKKRAR